MKKFSISMFAVLAILMAIGSAFTTKNTTETSKSKFVTDGWYAAITQDIDPLAIPNYNTTDFDDQLLGGAPDPGLEQGQCSDNEDVVCAAEFDDDVAINSVEGSYNFE